jgi:hypothetical protein
MGATRASYRLGHVPGRGRTPTIFLQYISEGIKIRHFIDMRDIKSLTVVYASGGTSS